MKEPEAKTKPELEREKLRLEIAELNRSWWMKPTYIAAMFPTLLAVITLVYGFTNGYFQASFVKLENQKHDLQMELNVIQERKAKLEVSAQRILNVLKDIQKAEVSGMPGRGPRAEQMQTLENQLKQEFEDTFERTFYSTRFKPKVVEE